MNEQHDIRSRNEMQFRQIALRVLKHAGFEEYVPEKKLFDTHPPKGLLKKGDTVYCLETFHSRRELYTSRAILNTVENLIQHAKKHDYLPLLVVGGVLIPALKADILGKSIRTVLLDIQNLLYIASDDQDLYDELLAQLPYTPANFVPREPDYLPLPDWNAAYAGRKDWEVTVSLLRPNKDKTVVPPPEPEQDNNGEADERGHIRAAGVENPERKIEPVSEDIFDWEAFWDGGDIAPFEPDDEGKPYVFPGSALPKKRSEKRRVEHSMGTLASAGALRNILIAMQTKEDWEEAKKLKKDIQSWQGGKQTNAAAYEKLCTRTLMRIFADDLTLWREQAKSNSDLFRFDLICKIKRDNHKDFWEMAERYFGSKYIIFEFKNYSGKVTQKEVYTTVRYLYTKAMRGIAIIISPNGMDDNGGKACRGVLRDEGKLILSLTNDDLLEMLRMKEDGEDPADFLSDKLDELLIDLEK
jgi:hypothetical protein